MRSWTRPTATPHHAANRMNRMNRMNNGPQRAPPDTVTRGIAPVRCGAPAADPTLCLGGFWFDVPGLQLTVRSPRVRPEDSSPAARRAKLPAGTTWHTTPDSSLRTCWGRFRSERGLE